MFSLFTTASILPCGRYYYDLEGGYVGNTWIKWSYQFLYWYLGWLLYHLDHLDSLVYNTSHYLKLKLSKEFKIHQPMRIFDWNSIVKSETLPR
jgi:hypothetical protein